MPVLSSLQLGCNRRLTRSNCRRDRECQTAISPPLRLPVVDLCGIEQLLGIDERQSRSAHALRHTAVEARAATGVACRPDLFDPNPDRILIAIDPHLDHALYMPGAFAFAPERLAAAAEVPGLSARDGLAQSFIIHMRDHQDLAGPGVGRNACDKAGGVEFGLERQPLLAVVRFC